MSAIPMFHDSFSGVRIYPDDDVPEGEMRMHPRDYQNAIGCYRPNAADGRMCALVRSSHELGALTSSFDWGGKGLTR